MSRIVLVGKNEEAATIIIVTPLASSPSARANVTMCISIVSASEIHIEMTSSLINVSCLNQKRSK